MQMWNTLFAASFKYILSDLHMHTDMAGSLYLKTCPVAFLAVFIYECLTLATTGIKAQG